jgi:hypothetical protein
MTVFVFDIDGTLCSDSKGDYKFAEPFLDRVKIVNQLFNEGHTVILQTARGMGSTGNNVEKAHQMWKQFTVAQLKSWGLNYHQIFFGKPAGDFYIDDKAVHESSFFEHQV